MFFWGGIEGIERMFFGILGRVLWEYFGGNSESIERVCYE